MGPTSNPIPTYWLFGLPVEQLSLETATELIARKIRRQADFVFATPNLNFLRTASQDPVFQAAVLRCDMSLADGMPLLWLAKLAGFDLPERVAGSDLFDRLMASADSEQPIRAFFYGGPPGAAQAACKHIDTLAGVAGAGALTPGFGSVDDLSDNGTLSAIRSANPNFLVVALGARKGHLWIDRNRASLSPVVSSHLGAVVNFAAGTVKRAPGWMARIGLEWIWRILQEPNLFRRYSDDALFLGSLIVESIRVRRRVVQSRSSPRATACDLQQHEAGRWHARISGPFVGTAVDAFDARLAAEVPEGCLVNLDLSDATRIDARGLGALYCWRFRSAWRCSILPTSLCASLVADVGFHRAQILLETAEGRSY